MEGEGKSSLRSWIALLVALAVFVGGIGIGTTVDRQGGTVQDIYYTSSIDGSLLHGRLYIPANATKDTPAPVIVHLPGNDASSEKYSSFSVEFARRGYVVFAADLRGQGTSVGNTKFYPVDEEGNIDALGAVEATEYVRSLPFVDIDNVIIGGHSMGGEAALKATHNNPDWYKGLFTLGGATFMMGLGDPPPASAGPGPVFPETPLVPDIDDKDNLSILMVTGRDDGDAQKRGGLIEFLGIADASEYVSGKVYGSYDLNNVRISYQADAIHNYEYLHSATIGVVLDFVQNVITPEHQIDGSNQVWQWRYIGTMIALIALVYMIMMLGSILLKTPFFSTIRCEAPVYKGNRKGRWWFFAILTAIVGPLTYFHLSALGPKWLNNDIWNVQRITGVLGWALAVAGITVVVLIIGYFATKKENRPTLYNYGLTFDKGKTISSIAKSLLLALIVVGVAYALLAVQYRWTFVDVRIWNTSFRVLNAQRVIRALAYVVPFMIAFVITSVNIFGTLRPKGGEISIAKEILITVAILAPWYLLWAIWFGPFAWLETSGARPSFGGMLYAFFWAAPTQLALVALINTYFNRKTGRVYVGAIISAMLITWMLVGELSATL